MFSALFHIFICAFVSVTHTPKTVSYFCVSVCGFLSAVKEKGKTSDVAQFLSTETTRTCDEVRVKPNYKMLWSGLVLNETLSS